jgi:hypothetical protein
MLRPILCEISNPLKPQTDLSTLRERLITMTTSFTRSKVAGALLALAVTMGAGSGVANAAISGPGPSVPVGTVVNNAAAQDDSTTAISGVKTVIKNIHANDTTSSPSANWFVNQDFLIDMATGNKSVDVNGVQTLTTADGVAELVVNADGTVDAYFTSKIGYKGTPAISYFSQDTNGATAQANLVFTIAPATGGAVVPNASAQDDTATSLDGGIASNANVLANDKLSTPDATWDTSSIIAIDLTNPTNRASVVDGKAVLVTAEGTSTFTVEGVNAVSYAGDVTTAPNISYFIVDSKGASAMANINVTFASTGEPPVETPAPVVDTPAPVVDVPVTAPETPGAETPVDAPVTAPEAPVVTPEVSSSVPVATNSGSTAPTAHVSSNAQDDNLAETAAESGFTLGDILAAGVALVAMMGFGILASGKKSRKAATNN